jgi:hypothetical protein
MARTLILLALLLFPAAARPAEPTFDVQQSRAISSNAPLLILVGAQWCPGCQFVEHHPQLMAAMRGYGVLALVDVDRRPDLARKYNPTGAPIPRLIVYPRFPGGWGEETVRVGPEAIAKLFGVDLGRKVVPKR